MGPVGTSDGNDGDSSFTQLHGVWHEGQVTYVTDATTGSVRMIISLAGTVKFLRHFGMLYDTFGVHQKGKTPTPASIPNAIQTLNKIVTFVDDCSTNVKVITKKKTPTTGPDGTISNKTQGFCLPWFLNILPFRHVFGEVSLIKRTMTPVYLDKHEFSNAANATL